MKGFKHDFPEESVVKAWRHEGRPCVIVNVRGTHYCGYSRTYLRDLSHDVTSKYSEHGDIILFDINGGLTYGPDECNFVGFDCGHSWDRCYDERGNLMTKHTFGDESKEWYLDDVVDEVEYLAEQLECLEKFVEAQ